MGEWRRSDGNKPDSQKRLSSLSQKFAMSNFMMMVLNKVSYGSGSEMIIADFYFCRLAKELESTS